MAFVKIICQSTNLRKYIFTFVSLAHWFGVVKALAELEMKVHLLWDVTLCRLVTIHIHQSVWYNITEDLNLSSTTVKTLNLTGLYMLVL
jgi:hypothetical protein